MNTKLHTALQSKAELIYSRTKKSEFSIITILTILQLLIALYRLWQTCNQTAEQVDKMFKKPTFLQRTIIKKVVHRSIPNDFDANQVYKELMAVMKETPKKEIQLLFSKEEE